MGTRERLRRTKVHGVSVRPNLHLQRVHTFVEFGEAASSPTYHTLDETYYLTPNTIYTIGDALRGAIKSESGQTWWNGLFPSRKSHTGIWNDFDFGFVIDHSTSVASQRDIPIGQHLENVEVVLGSVGQSRAAQLNSKTLSLLSSNVKDVIWQIVERESAFVGNRWKENDWDATIKKYPDMSKPNSDLFKEVTAELKTLHGNDAAEVTVRRKVVNMVHLCFGG